MGQLTMLPFVPAFATENKQAPQDNRILNYPSRDREGAVRVDPGKTAPSVKSLVALHPNKASRLGPLNLKSKRNVENVIALAGYQPAANAFSVFLELY